jgi:hypothetical protein
VAGPDAQRIPTYLLRDQRVARLGTIDIDWALQPKFALRDRCLRMAVTFDAAEDGNNVYTERLIRPCE